MNNSPGKIFVSYERGILESRFARQFCTLNFGSFQNEHKQPLGPFYMVNDTVLNAAQTLSYTAGFLSYIITLPITGQLLTGLDKTLLDVEQLRVDGMPAGQYLSVQNPFPADWVNYLQFGIKVPERLFKPKSEIYSFQLENPGNSLVSILPTDSGLPFLMHMGTYDGRRESVYTLQNTHSLLFAFVVAGAFEFEGRLLHERDGLALWDHTQVELEALSSGAVIVLIEMNLLV